MTDIKLIEIGMTLKIRNAVVNLSKKLTLNIVIKFENAIDYKNRL